MKLPVYVKPFPTFLNFLGGKGYKAINGKIYLRSDIYNDLKSDKPDPTSVSLLIHEEVHLKNMNKLTSLKYIFSRKNRLEEELSAYREQFKYLKEHNRNYDLDKLALKLSGPLYMYSTNYETAKKKLERIWREA